MPDGEVAVGLTDTPVAREPATSCAEEEAGTPGGAVATAGVLDMESVEISTVRNVADTGALALIGIAFSFAVDRTDAALDSAGAIDDCATAESVDAIAVASESEETMEARLEITAPTDAVGVEMAADAKAVATDDDPDEDGADEIGPADDDAAINVSPRDDVVSEDGVAGGKVV